MLFLHLTSQNDQILEVLTHIQTMTMIIDKVISLKYLYDFFGAFAM